MSCEDVYRRLAERLNAIPNGYPPTLSGVELRLLAKLFSPEQAALGAEMRLTFEPAAEIAARVGCEPAEAGRLLKAMARRGLISARRVERGLGYALRPFVVGFYEAQLERMDRELAALVEQYFVESGYAMARHGPSVHRVIPVGQAIGADLAVFPYEHAASLVEGAKSWAVGPCICRLQKRALGEGCDHTLEACLWFAPVENAFQGSTAGRAISREEALDLLRTCAEEGLVATASNTRGGIYYICNCCPCCCGVLRGLIEGGHPAAVAHSAFRATVDVVACAGCGACAERCHFGALSLADSVAVVDAERCVGCGQCVMACPTGALTLQRLPGDEAPPLPVDEDEWRRVRAVERGIRLEDVL